MTADLTKQFQPPRFRLWLRGVRWARVRHVAGRVLVLVTALLVLTTGDDEGQAYNLLMDARSKAERPVHAVQDRAQGNAIRYAALIAACAQGVGFKVPDSGGATFVACSPMRVETTGEVQ